MANIVNIVNFVRGKEPRDRSLDLTETIREEIRLNKKYGFPNTILLQYDAMNQPEFAPLIADADDGTTEFGFWFELVQPLCEKVGIAWRGRPGYEWDWHVCPGFLMAYTESEKKLLIDEAMENFKEHFGHYPKSVGSWLLDSFSVDYMYSRYGVSGFAICREQWGTDGYTLWGGYYNGAYYPSKENIFTPAQSAKYQINAPVFRLLGADPIHCYTEKAVNPAIDVTKYGLHTLEPYWTCGKSERWVDWYFSTMFASENFGFAYTQIGQENSFNFAPMKESLPMQYEYLANAAKAGLVEVKTLGDTAEWFSDTYSSTPATVMTALTDWHESNCQSVWYNCRNYRFNLAENHGMVFIRDIHKFDEQYRDSYLDKPVDGNCADYDNLPVIDGLRFSDEVTEAGIFLGEGKILSVCRDEEDFIIRASADGKMIRITLTPDRIYLKCNEEFTLRYVVKDGCSDIVGNDAKGISFCHNGYGYRLELTAGSYADNTITSESGKIKFTLR